MQDNYEVVATLVKEYKKIYEAKKIPYITHSMFFISFFLFALVLLVFFAGLFSGPQFTLLFSVLFFFFLFILVFYTAKTHKGIFKKITEIFSDFFFPVEKDIDKDYPFLVMLLLDNKKVILLMSKEENGPWFKWGQDALSILKNHKKI